MNDTSPDIEKYYPELIMSKTHAERFLMGLDMVDDGYQIMICGIRSEHHGIDEEHIRLEILKRHIKYDPGLKWLEPLIEALEKKEDIN